MKIRIWPRSLATRTALVLLIGLALVQMAGLTIHALDRLDVQRLAQARDLAVRVVGVYRTGKTDQPFELRYQLVELTSSHLSTPDEYTSRSNVRAEGPPRSPVHRSTTR